MLEYLHVYYWSSMHVFSQAVSDSTCFTLLEQTRIHYLFEFSSESLKTIWVVIQSTEQRGERLKYMFFHIMSPPSPNPNFDILGTLLQGADWMASLFQQNTPLLAYLENLAHSGMIDIYIFM